MTYNEGVMKSDGRMRRFLEKAISRLAASRRGAAAVEFALLAPVVVVFLIGLANYGMAQFQKMEMESAARAGAQMALKDRTATTTIENAAINATNLTLVAGDITLTPSYACNDGTFVSVPTDTCADNDPIQYFMTVRVDKDFVYLFGFEDLIGTFAALSESVKVRTQ